jgi:hypothetical protein
MVALSAQADFRAIQRMTFCYVCGEQFKIGDNNNRDHLPPRNAFDKGDRTPVLWLPTHYDCNWQHRETDEKIGQLISLKRHQVPAPKNRKLRFRLFPLQGVTAIDNLHLDHAIWRWVRGFHAALYKEFVPDLLTRSLVTPFPRLELMPYGAVLHPILQQHLVIVATLKTNRAKQNLDTIRSNNGQFSYDCVWIQDDDKHTWVCMFGMNIYDWKDMGEVGLPPRGCAGCYYDVPGGIPAAATRATTTKIIAPNVDRLDPFGR